MTVLRIKRGLYKSALGILINADVNGSLNILKKAIPNDESR
jgi:putative transposase